MFARTRLLTVATAALAAGWMLAQMTTRSLPAAPPPKPEPKLSELRDELEQLKTLIPDQAHIMQDVGYHFTNLWLAANSENWPLAEFYFGETKSHLHWAVRAKPKRKDSQNREIDLVAILQAVENSPLKQLDAALKSKDKAAVDKAYRFTLEGCYDCHKASDKPYLRPQVPTAAEVQIINFDPTATWPR